MQPFIQGCCVWDYKFILYLKEMEWRYNNRNEDLFEMLVYYMLGGSVPDLM
jgi:hypothetical protein